MEKLIAYLEQRSYKEAEAYIDEVMEEVDAYKETLIEESKQKLNLREKRALEKLQELKKQKIAHAQYEEKNKTSQHKEQLIHSLLEECEAYFNHLSDEEYCFLIERCLQKHETKENPRLLVKQPHYEAVVNRFGQQYQVIAADKIRSGFVLSFSAYDVNFEIDQIFRYYREALTKHALDGLFGVTGYEQ